MKKDTPAPPRESQRDGCVKCGRTKFKTEGDLCFWCRKEASVAKKDLEDFCINSNAIRFHPGIARLMAKEFGLDMERIRERWMEIGFAEAERRK
jgi:hypothetical protein